MVQSCPGLCICNGQTVVSIKVKAACCFGSLACLVTRVTNFVIHLSHRVCCLKGIETHWFDSVVKPNSNHATYEPTCSPPSAAAACIEHAGPRRVVIVLGALAWYPSTVPCPRPSCMPQAHTMILNHFCARGRGIYVVLRPWSQANFRKLPPPCRCAARRPLIIRCLFRPLADLDTTNVTEEPNGPIP